MNKLSICVFIKNNNHGGFCLWESMATLMPIADEFFVLDLGSDDGTWETLKRIAEKNKKVRIEQGDFPINPVTGLKDSGSFAVIPNQMIPTLKNDLVMYYQADEIFHEYLLGKLADSLSGPKYKDFRGFSFWRYQLSHNFQRIKWHPHPVHRIDYKERFTFVDDGMNSNRTHDAEMFSDYGAGWFTRWGQEYSLGEKTRVDGDGNPYIYGDHFKEKTDGNPPYQMPTHDMILDISSLGGFLWNVRNKAKLHSPLWRSKNNSISIGGIFYNADDWYFQERNNKEWLAKETPFNIPEIMKPHLGEFVYKQREDLIEKICNST